MHLRNAIQHNLLIMAATLTGTLNSTHTTHRRRIDLSDTRAFGHRAFEATLPDAPGLRWARLAVWDIAGNDYTRADSGNRNKLGCRHGAFSLSDRRPEQQAIRSNRAMRTKPACG